MRPAALHRVDDPRSAASIGGEIALDEMSHVRILGRLGEGGRSTVHDATWRGRPVALKLYKAEALVRHARKRLAVSLPRFEYERNARFLAVPDLEGHVARPLAWIATPGLSAFLQERIEGELYYFHQRARNHAVDDALFGQVRRIVHVAHEAGLFDVDLHAMNVIVARTPDGRPLARIFDFNLVPFDVRPPNPFVGFLLRTGLRSRRERDLRKLRNFHDFTRVERKLLRFYPDAAAAAASTPAHRVP